ncbi:MAG: hypothetical protein LQ351_000129 [Letrouitia transgressa]|nr:MAG: hypothetical protein LQ351_000129 [Letrouitia transgressa]
MSTSNKYISRLRSKRVLVIGGTSGIGFCVAEAALEHGASVCISGSKQSKLDNAISRLRTSYPDKESSVSGQVCDLSQPAQLESNVQNLLAHAAAEGRIDHIAFTAGDALKITPVAQSTVEGIQQVGHVRFLAPLMIAKHAPQYMSPGPASSLTLTSGTNTQRPSKDWAVVAAWGGAIDGMTKGLAVDLAPIRVNCVSPGAVKTELFDGIPAERREGMLKAFREASLIDRVGKPENLAEAYIYTMKDEFLTGTVFQSDGGRLLK